MVLGWEEPRKIYGRFPIERAQPDFKEKKDYKMLKRIGAGVAITLGVIGTCVLAYKSDETNARLSRESYAECLHEAQVVIPELEKKGYTGEAERLENEAWTFISQAKQGRWQVSSKELQVLTDLLNNNNTKGAKRGEPLP